MRSELNPHEMYVVCRKCLVAEKVENLPQAMEVMKGHARVFTGHDRGYNGGWGVVFFHRGSVINTWATAQIGDLREINEGNL